MRKFHNTLTGIALLFSIKGIPNLTRTYRKIYNDRKSNRGKSDSITFLKALLVCGERYALHQPIDPVPWTKSDRDGFPTVIKAFKPYLRGSRFERILALSVLRSVESLRLPISRDISSVTDPPLYCSETVRKITNFMRNELKWIKPLKLKPLKYHLTFKKGPNGPALKTSDSDVAGLLMSTKLLGAIQVVQEKLGGSYPIDNTFKCSDTPGVLSKLTQFPEKAGKTRTIAVLDYYSQRALRPLHKALMNLLRSLESDGTFSHRNVGEWAKQRTYEKSHIFCADLTAATDRFPSVIQKELLDLLIPDSDLASAYWTILTDRQFTVAWSGEKVQYAVGQPMGAYSSWPLFALAHHVTAEYCHGRKAKTVYRMIGDDFISSSVIQSQRYKEVMKHLGVNISYNKTVESPKDSQFSSAEVAKQLFLNGDNLSPLTPGFVTDLVKPHMFNMCLVELRSRYDPLPVTPAVLLDKLFKGKVNQRVWCLASNPRNGAIKPSDEGYESNSPWAKKDLSLYDIVYRNLTLNSITMKAEIMFDELLDSPEYGYQGSPQQDSDPRVDAQLHVEEQLRADLSDAMIKLNAMEAFAFDPSDEDSANIVQYIVDPRDQYKSRKEQRSIVESYLIEEILPELPERTTQKGSMLETKAGKASMLDW